MAKNKLSNWVKNAFLFAVSSFISILLLEFGIRIFLPQDRQVTWIEMHERGFVMNQSGGTAFQELDDRHADYRFTTTRLRGDEIVLEDTITLNILTFGDSFTFGLLLQEEDTYVRHLQTWADQNYPIRTNFLNAAVGGSGLADWPAWLETFGNDVHPDVVIYFLNNNDVFRALSKNLYVLDSSENLKLIDSKRWQPRPFLQKLGRKDLYRKLQAHSDLMNLIVKFLWRYFYFEDLTHDFDPEKSETQIPDLTAYEENNPYSLELSKALFGKMETWCEENDCSLVIANTGFFSSEMVDPYTTQIHQFLKDSTDSYLNIYPCMNEKVNGDFSQIQIPGDSHPDETGSRMIADCLIEQLPDFLPLR